VSLALLVLLLDRERFDFFLVFPSLQASKVAKISYKLSETLVVNISCYIYNQKVENYK